MDQPRHSAPAYTLRQLAHLSAVAESGSISRAAQALHLSPSALAASLDELERALGARLCVRRKAHGITLTADGDHVLREARGVLAAARDLAASVGGGGALVGSLRIGCYHTLAPTVLPHLLRATADRHPGLTVDVLEADGDELQQRVASGDVDLAVMYERDVSGDVDVEPLYGLVPHVLLAAGHRLAGAPFVRLADLVEDPLVLLDLPPSRQHTLELFNAVGLVPRVRHRTTGYELARALVGRDLGYAVLVQRPRTSRTYEGQPVVVKELRPAVPPVAVVLLRPRGRSDARAEAISRLLHEQVANLRDGA